MNEILVTLNTAQSLATVVEVVRNPLKGLRKMRDFGDIVKLGVGKSEIYLINNPDTIVSLADPDAKLGKDTRDIRLFREILGESIFTMDSGSAWRARRMLAAPSLHAKAVEGYKEAINVVTEQTFNEWESSPSRDGLLVINDLRTEFECLALKIGLVSLFGKRVNRTTSLELNQAINQSLTFASRMVRSLGWQHEVGKLARGISHLGDFGRRKVSNFLDELIESAEIGKDDNLLKALVSAHSSDPNNYSRSDLYNDLRLLLITSYISTAQSLVWSVSDLSKKPEIAALIGEEASTDLVAKSLTPAPLVVSSYKESLRLHPPLWLFLRKTNQSLQISDDFSLPAGATLIISPYLVQTDERNWVNAQEYDPMRFLEYVPRKGTYIPFGFDSRSCMGAAFSMAEGPLVLSKFFERYRVVNLDHPAGEETEAILKPKGNVRVELQRV